MLLAGKNILKLTGVIILAAMLTFAALFSRRVAPVNREGLIHHVWAVIVFGVGIVFILSFSLGSAIGNVINIVAWQCR